MSLSFDLREIPEDVRTTTALADDPIDGIKAGDRIQSPITHTLIWSTMAVGIGVLDDETIPEFHARLALLAKLGHFGTVTLPVVEDGEWTGEWHEARSITLEEVRAHKGLKTNVFPMESRASFVKRWITTDNTLFPSPEPKRKR